MVSRKGMTWFVIVLVAVSAGCTAAPAVAAEPSSEHQVIPNPPEEDPEPPASENGHSLRVSDAVYRVESGESEVESELVRWRRGLGYGGWGRRGFGYGGWGYRRFGYPGWGWGGRRWAFAPIYRPYYGGYFGYPAFAYGYGNANPVYGNQFAYGYGSPYGYGGYGMGYPYNYGYLAY
jgi:hypothetical protein